jgi:hypothetical protein
MNTINQPQSNDNVATASAANEGSTEQPKAKRRLKDWSIRKITLIPRCDNGYPWVKFGGRYLEKFGFELYRTATVCLQPGKIMITLDPKAPLQPPTVTELKERNRINHLERQYQTMCNLEAAAASRKKTA